MKSKPYIVPAIVAKFIQTSSAFENNERWKKERSRRHGLTERIFINWFTAKLVLFAR